MLDLFSFCVFLCVFVCVFLYLLHIDYQHLRKFILAFFGEFWDVLAGPHDFIRLSLNVVFGFRLGEGFVFGG